MMLGKFLFAIALGLLVALVLLPPEWHLLAGIVGWLVMRLGARDVHRGFGRLHRWLMLLIVLGILGAFFGKPDANTMGFEWSMVGTLSGTTMVVRAFALVALVSVASSALPLRRWLDRISNPVVLRFLGVAVVATNLVPVQLRALSVASNNLKERRPGIRRFPKRLWLLSVHSVLRAAMLAESVAFDMAVAAHNADDGGKEST